MTDFDHAPRTAQGEAAQFVEAVDAVGALSLQFSPDDPAQAEIAKKADRIFRATPELTHIGLGMLAMRYDQHMTDMATLNGDGWSE
jgi:hypothetical protein